MSISVPPKGTKYESRAFKSFLVQLANIANQFEAYVPEIITQQKQFCFFPVKLELTYGSAGDATTPCSFEYTVKTLNNVIIGNNMSPAWRPQNLGRLVSGNGLIGQGYYDENGNFVLFMAAEQIDAAACP